MTYEVLTLTNLPHFSSQQLLVRRRFKDFVSLAKLLPQHLHGSFLPARPHRNAIESARNTPDFVSERRMSLERYLNRLAAHKDVARSEVLRVFLEADGNLRTHPAWLALRPKHLSTAQATQRLLKGMVSGVGSVAPTPSEVVQPAGVAGDVYRMIHERTSSLRRSSSGVPVSTEESTLRDAETLMEDLGAAQDLAASRTNRWVASLEALAAAQNAMATAIGAVGSYEGSCGKNDNAAVLTVASHGCSRSGSALSATASSTATVLQPVHDYRNMHSNIMTALAARRAALLTVQTLSADLDRVRNRLGAASLTPATKAKKVESLRSQVARLEAALSAAQGEYQRQVARNASELCDFRKQRAQELSEMLEVVAADQAHHWSSLSSNWEAVVGQLRVQHHPATPDYFRAALYVPPSTSS